MPQLTSGHQPIGRLLEAEGVVVTREPMAGPGPGSGPFGAEAAPSATDVLLARTYRVLDDGVPVMVISEWFLTTLTPFLTRA